jgi:flagellar hook-associated protein 1 FlgK
VGRSQAAPAAPLTGGSTFTDAWAAAMSDIGVRVQGAKTASEISGAMADSAEASLSAVSGVNLDEEAAHLLQQQQAYQACAKVLQIAQQVFQELLAVAGQ